MSDSRFERPGLNDDEPGRPANGLSDAGLLESHGPDHRFIDLPFTRQRPCFTRSSTAESLTSRLADSVDSFYIESLTAESESLTAKRAPQETRNAQEVLFQDR